VTPAGHDAIAAPQAGSAPAAAAAGDPRAVAPPSLNP
jgi:hypothetical protein